MRLILFFCKTANVMIEPMVIPIVNPNFIKNPPDNSMGGLIE